MTAVIGKWLGGRINGLQCIQCCISAANAHKMTLNRQQLTRFCSFKTSKLVLCQAKAEQCYSYSRPHTKLPLCTANQNLETFLEK